MLQELLLPNSDSRDAGHRVAMHCKRSEQRNLSSSSQTAFLPVINAGIPTSSHRVQIDLKAELRALSADFTDSLRARARAELRECPVGHELWTQTCFEVFVELSEGAYLELHLSADLKTAAYFLKGYRAGLEPLKTLRTLARLKFTEPGSAVFEARFEFEVGELRQYAITGRSGLTAVVIASEVLQGGSLVNESQPFFWALQHSSEKPDFHLSKNWIHRL